MVESTVRISTSPRSGFVAMVDTERLLILRMVMDCSLGEVTAGLFASAFSRFFGDVSDPDFRPIHTNQLAAPESQPGGGKDEEEFLGLQDFKRSLDFQPCAAIRNVE
jgi:hypothetical protein